MGLHHYVLDGKPLAGNYGLSHDKLLGVPVNVTPNHGIYPQEKGISPEKNEELTINTTDFHNDKEHGKPRRTLGISLKKNLGWINMASWPPKK